MSPQNITHQHISPQIVRAQILYTESEVSLFTAKEIISRKLRNCSFLLSAYRQSRARASYSQASFIERAQIRIRRVLDRLGGAGDRSSLFQLEAQAARYYWSAVGLICRQTPEWRRTYPHANDHLNILLNTGYTAMARKIISLISASHFLPEIGILHGSSSGEALAYDIMECFRQPAVDAAIMPIFARKRNLAIELSEKDMRRGFARLSHQLEKRFPYKGRCERLERIMELEVLNLKKSILEKSVWKPYLHRWGHSWQCSNK